tara:strand:+ start:588 stop:755 length:168 start_codon:yes stop_codon:yes gene_type:complete
MKNSEVSFSTENYTDLDPNQIRIVCEKCGGNGNLKTPENSRRTCLACYGKGFRSV